MNLKEIADPGWDSDIPSTMSAENITGPYYQNMLTMFKFTENNLEDMFLMHQIQDCHGLQKEAFPIQFRFIQIK